MHECMRRLGGRRGARSPGWELRRIREDAGLSGSQVARHAVVEGTKFGQARPNARLLTLGMATYNFGYNVAFATLVLFAQDRLGLSSTGFGILLAVAGRCWPWVEPLGAGSPRGCML